MKSEALKYFEGERYNQSYDLPHIAAFLDSLKANVKALYHYTAKGNAKYIVGDNAVITCKHTGLMDDVGEVREGTYILTEHIGSRYPDKAKAIKEELDKAWDEYEKFRQLSRANWQTYEDTGNRPLDMIMHVMPHIFCVTLQADAPYQWRNYTDKKDKSIGGYCFSFNADKLGSAIKRRNDAELTKVDGNMSALQLMPCFYKEIDDMKIMRLADSLVQDIERDLIVASTIENMTRILGAIFTVAPLIKNRKFYREQEYRLILVDPHSKVVDRKSLGLPSGNLSINLMSSIMLSPQGNKAELRDHLLGMCSAAKDMLTDSRIHETVVEQYITREGDVDLAYEENVLAKVDKNEAASVISQEEFLASDSKETPSHA